MARKIKRKPRPNYSYRETGNKLRTRKYPYTPSGSYTMRGKKSSESRKLDDKIRAGIRKTRKVAAVSEVGRRVGRGVKSHKNRMPRR